MHWCLMHPSNLLQERHIILVIERVIHYSFEPQHKEESSSHGCYLHTCQVFPRALLVRFDWGNPQVFFLLSEMVSRESRDELKSLCNE